MVEVAAAVILRADGAFLLARRPPGKVYAGWWEFPGGKVETGEPPAQALARELHEELGIVVRSAWPWLTRVFTYAHATVRLNFFRVTEWEGEPQPREGQVLAWQRLDAPLLEPMLPANAPILASLALPGEYAVSAVEKLGEEEFMRRLEARLKGGLRLLQLREKGLMPEALDNLARSVCALAQRYGARVLLNADAESARKAGADGVHYTALALSRLVERPAGLLVAASCHTAEELVRAMALGFDFAVLGPVAATPSHPDAVTLGWDQFAEITRGASLPVYAIGGMRPGDLEVTRRAGGHGIAMLSGAWAKQG